MLSPSPIRYLYRFSTDIPAPGVQVLLVVFVALLVRVELLCRVEMDISIVDDVIS